MSSKFAVASLGSLGGKVLTLYRANVNTWQPSSGVKLA